MKLFDLHAHTSGISTCCRAPAPGIVKEASDTGIDGIVLTNHYQRQNAGDHADYAKRYTDEYYYTKTCGEAVGCSVFYGMEVTMEQHGGAHILLYGVEPSFTLAHPCLFALPLETLYAMVKEEGGAVVQAHPFRNSKNTLQDLTFLDGMEASSHPLYDGTHIARLTELGHLHGKILTSGGDYHADTPYRPHCGVYLPDSVTDTASLAQFLLTTDCVDLRIQEPHAPESLLVTYSRQL